MNPWSRKGEPHATQSNKPFSRYPPDTDRCLAGGYPSGAVAAELSGE